MTTGPVVAVIHAKGSSQRLPGKNLRLLGAKPLFCHALDTALRAALVDHVAVDSDSEEILEIGCQRGAGALRRPARLATNETTGDELAHWQARNFPASAIILQVVPTSPFISSDTIDRAVQLLRNGQADSVVGVRSEVFYSWGRAGPNYFDSRGRIPNSFELAPLIYETTGLYGNRTRSVLKTGRRLSPDPERCVLLHLSRVEAIDINTAEDFAFAEIVWRGLETANESASATRSTRRNQLEPAGPHARAQ